MVALKYLKDDRAALLAALSEPFPREAIEHTKGAETRKGYDTSGIKYQYVVDRLNEVLGLEGWRTQADYEVDKSATKSGRDKYSVVCVLTMQIGDVGEDGVFRIWAERQGTGGHDSVTEADARKGAYTNGLKKVAAMFGVGRQAYAGTLDDDNIPPPREREASARGEIRKELEGLTTLFGGKDAVVAVIGRWPDSLGEARRAVAQLKAVHAQRLRDAGGHLKTVPAAGAAGAPNTGAADEPSLAALPAQPRAVAASELWGIAKRCGADPEHVRAEIKRRFNRGGAVELTDAQRGELAGWMEATWADSLQTGGARETLAAARRGGDDR